MRKPNGFDRLLRPAAGAAILLGLLHTGLGLASYRGPEADTLWFLGAGFSLLLVALVNLAVWRDPPASGALRLATHLSNGVMLLFGIEAIRALGEPPAYAVTLVMAGLLTAGLATEKSGHYFESRSDRS